jgi:hypothetical protein
MTLRPARLIWLLALLACAGSACQLKRPDVLPVRMIEPQLSPLQASEARSGSAARVHLLDTQARGHIGRRILHQESNGELIEDPIWHWSSWPDRYLDSVLRLVFGSSPQIRLVDTAGVPTLAVTLTTWHLDTTGGTHLVGTIELAITTADRAVVTQVVRKVEPVSAELPGDLSPAAGRLLNALAAESLAQTVRAVRP